MRSHLYAAGIREHKLQCFVKGVLRNSYTTSARDVADLYARGARAYKPQHPEWVEYNLFTLFIALFTPFIASFTPSHLLLHYGLFILAL